MYAFRLAVTGHRPEKLAFNGLRAYSKEMDTLLYYFAKDHLTKQNPDIVISGMALGWDIAMADAAIALDIPVAAAVPFEGQEKKWPTSSQKRYHAILKKCQVVQIVSPGDYSAVKMDLRNQWMVNHCDRLLALHDGSFGGTNNCVRFAGHKGIQIVNVWEDWLEFTR